MPKLRGPPLLEGKDSSSGRRLRKVRMAEVAGGTTAECAAVCCCIPFCLVNLLVQAVYKVPAGLCRNALRRKRQLRLMKKGMLPAAPQCSFCDDSELRIHHLSPTTTVGTALEPEKDAIELEKEMWDKFYGAGFWRSISQRSEFTKL